MRQRIVAHLRLIFDGYETTGDSQTVSFGPYGTFQQVSCVEFGANLGDGLRRFLITVDGGPADDAQAIGIDVSDSGNACSLSLKDFPRERTSDNN
jgi:hypothetical protein